MASSRSLGSGEKGTMREDWTLLLYVAVGAGLLLVGLALLVGGRRTRLRNVKGNVIVGDVEGTATQTYTAPPAPAPSTGIGRKEVIGWLLAVPGALLAAWNLWKALSGG
jgi:hypothetical protein